MLVLSRMKNESIVINGNVEVTVVDVRGDRIRLGIVAPKHVQVHRREVFDQLVAEGRESDKELNDLYS